jgi:hypothetical protein
LTVVADVLNTLSGNVMEDDTSSDGMTFEETVKQAGV